MVERGNEGPEKLFLAALGAVALTAERADELAGAIDTWLEKKKADPMGIDPVKLDEFGKWASERKQLAAQTSSLTSGQELRW